MTAPLSLYIKSMVFSRTLPHGTLGYCLVLKGCPKTSGAQGLPGVCLSVPVSSAPSPTTWKSPFELSVPLAAFNANEMDEFIQLN